MALSRHPSQGLKDATRTTRACRRCAPSAATTSGSTRRDAWRATTCCRVATASSPSRPTSRPPACTPSAAAKAGDVTAAEAADAPLAALHRDLFCEANPIPVKWALAKMGRAAEEGIRLPLVPLGVEYHGRVDAALKQGGCIESEDGAGTYGGSYGWPSRKVRIEGHLFDSGLINQAMSSSRSAAATSRSSPSPFSPTTSASSSPSSVCRR